MRHETLDAVIHPNISLRIMERFLIAQGLDPAPAFEAAGVRRADWCGTTPSVSGLQELNFQRAFVRITGYRPRLWVRLGQCYRAAAYGPLGLALLTAPSMRDFVQFGLSATFTYSLARTIPIEVDDHLIGMELDVGESPDDMRDFVICRALGSGTRLLQDLWGGRFPFSLICASIDVPGDEIQSILDYPVRCGADRTVWFWPAALSDLPLFHSDPLLHKAYAGQLTRELDRHGPAASFLSRVEQTIQSLDETRLSMAQAAKALGIAPRTLQRRLEQCGTSYRAIVDMVRRRRAIHLLSSTTITVSEIAARVGYSDLTSFDHAFHRWTGFAPSEFRENQLTQAPRAESPDLP